MIGDWANQGVSRYADRRKKYALADGFAELITPDYNFLDQAWANGTVFKNDQTTTVSLHQATTQEFVLKRYNPRSHGHKVKRALRRSRARRCWSMSYAFNRAGLNVPRPVLMYERRIGPIRTDAYFVNVGLPGEELLGLLPTMCSADQQKVVVALQKAFGQMRQHRLSHGDMKASNLLWVDGELYFIDLDAASQHRSAASWQSSYRRDLRRFLKNWEEQPELLELFSGLS